MIAACHGIAGSIEHGGISLGVNLLHKGNGNIRPLLLTQIIKHTAFLFVSLAVKGHRIGNPIPGNVICHPQGFFPGLFLRGSGGEEIYTQLDPRCLGFLHIVTGIGVGIDPSVLLRTAVAHPDHGKINPRPCHLAPVYGSLVSGYVDAHGDTLLLLYPLGYQQLGYIHLTAKFLPCRILGILFFTVPNILSAVVCTVVPAVLLPTASGAFRAAVRDLDYTTFFRLAALFTLLVPQSHHCQYDHDQNNCHSHRDQPAPSIRLSALYSLFLQRHTLLLSLRAESVKCETAFPKFL